MHMVVQMSPVLPAAYRLRASAPPRMSCHAGVITTIGFPVGASGRVNSHTCSMGVLTAEGITVPQIDAVKEQRRSLMRADVRG